MRTDEGKTIDSSSLSSSVRQFRRLMLALCSVVIMGCVIALVFARHHAGSRIPDPLFRGKPESEWIAGIKDYGSRASEEWASYGEEGVQVLLRGLRRAQDSEERSCRDFYRRVPGLLRKLIRDPRPDFNAEMREKIVFILWGMRESPRSAVPLMIETALNDESEPVRHGAIGFFNGNGSEKCMLNRLTPRDKACLFPVYLAALQNTNNAGLRHNASIGIKYFPEFRDKLLPALTVAMNDVDPHVQLYSAEAMNRLSTNTVQIQIATSNLVTLANGSNPEVLQHAIPALAHPGVDAEITVPGLLALLKGSNAEAACEVASALQWAPKNFDAHADEIVEALRRASQSTGSVSGYAKAALTRWNKAPAK